MRAYVVAFVILQFFGLARVYRCIDPYLEYTVHHDCVPEEVVLIMNAKDGGHSIYHMSHAWLDHIGTIFSSFLSSDCPQV